MIKLININKVYKNKNKNLIALNNINLEFDNQGFYFIYGESGSGKTTLLNIIAGFEQPTTGTVESSLSLEKIGIVFQNFYLFEELTVKENLSIFGSTEEEIEKSLIQVDLIDKKDVKAKVLSGGEKQRLCLVRAILKNIRVLLLDEPTGNLDYDNSVRILEIIKKVSKDILVIIVSHDYELVSSYADFEIYLKGGNITKFINKESNCSLKENGEEKSKNHFTFLWQLKYALNIFKQKLSFNLLSFILTTLALISFMLIFSLSNFDKQAVLKEALLQTNVEYLPIYKEEHSPYINETCSLWRGNLLKEELNDLCPLPYIQKKVVLEEDLRLHPTLIIVPDDYKFSNLKGSSGIVITDFLSDYFYKDIDIFHHELKLSFETELTYGTINHEATGIVSTQYNKEDLDAFKYNSNYVQQHLEELSFKYAIIYISESIFWEAIYGNPLAISGTSFYYPYSIGYDLTIKNKFKLYENELLKYGSEIKEAHDVIISDKIYNYLTHTDSFEVKEYPFKDIYNSPNANLYQQYFNMFNVAEEISVVGVYEQESNDILISSEFYNQIFEASKNFQFHGFLIEKNRSNLKKMISWTVENNYFFSLKDCDYVYSYAKQKSNIVSAFLVITPIIFLITILFILYSGFNLMQYKQKELVLLKSYGVNKAKLLHPFLIVEGGKSIIAYLIAMGAANIFMYKINYIILSLDINFEVLIIHSVTYGITFLLVILLTIVSILIPFISIMRKEIGIAFKDCNS